MANNGTYEHGTRYSYSELVVFTVLLAFYCFIGTSGNLAVLLIYRQQKTRQLHNLQIRALATIDLIICAFLIPYTICFELKYVSSDVVCRGAEFVRHTLEFFSNSVMCLIGLERYFAVLKPLNKLSYLQISIGIWSALLFSTTTSIPSVLIFTARQETTGLTINNTTEVITVCGFTTHIIGLKATLVYQLITAIIFLTSVLVLVSLYTTIYRTLWKKYNRKRNNRVGIVIIDDLMSNANMVPADAADRNPSTSRLLKSNLQPITPLQLNTQRTQKSISQKVGTMLFVCTVIYLMAWIPFFIDVFTSVGGLWFRYIFLFSHVTNPIVYGIINKDFRRQAVIQFRLDKVKNIIDFCV